MKYRTIGKRVIDIVLSIGAMPLIVFLAIPIALLVKIGDGGPVLYPSRRLGTGMCPFTMWKFRTMTVDAPDIRNEDGSTFNSVNDDRVTRVGRFLRKTSLDELPQLWNVLVGQMSWVGPRPSPTGNQDRYPQEYLRKFSVRPGVTGYNQALLRNSASMSERIANDLYYVDNLSLRLDLKIVAMTIAAVVRRKNINGE